MEEDTGRDIDAEQRPAKRRNMGTGAFNIGAAPIKTKQEAKKQAVKDHRRAQREEGGAFIRKSQQKAITKRDRKKRRLKEKALGT